jgi:hypothetical protein
MSIKTIQVIFSFVRDPTSQCLTMENGVLGSSEFCLLAIRRPLFLRNLPFVLHNCAINFGT